MGGGGLKGGEVRVRRLTCEGGRLGGGGPGREGGTGGGREGA
jgi:hypothetical protein